MVAIEDATKTVKAMAAKAVLVVVAIVMVTGVEEEAALAPIK
jgi:hypothetical protein